MWVEELPNGKYKFCERYEDPLTGKLKKVSLTGVKNTKAIRENMLIKLQEKINLKLSRKNNNDMTFKQASDSYIDLQKERVKPSTITRSKTHLRAINKDIGDILLTNLKSNHINGFFLKNMKNKRYTYNTAKQMRSLIVRVLNHAAKFYNIDCKKIISNIEVPQINKNKIDDLKYLEKEELDTVLKYFDDHDLQEFKRMAQIQVSTGMRYSEMISLDYVRDIDLDQHAIVVSKNYDFDNKIFTTPKTGNIRTIYFNDEIAKIIKSQIHYDKLKIVKYGFDKNNNLLFKSPQGNPIHTESFNRQLRRIPLEKNVTTHYFRHTFITMAVESGIDKDLIAKQVGHVDTKMMDRIYAHFTNKMKDKQKEAMLDFKII